MPKKNHKHSVVFFLIGAGIGCSILALAGWGAHVLFLKKNENRILPQVAIGGVPFGGQTRNDVEAYWLTQNQPFTEAVFEFRYGNLVATATGEILNLGYDATLSATQAYLVGRSPHILTNLYHELLSPYTDLTPYFRFDTQILSDMIEMLSQQIDIPFQDALFQFSNDKVTAFRPSRDGLAVNKQETMERFHQTLRMIPKSNQHIFVIPIPVDTVVPNVSTQQANTFGIKERIGRGYSEFTGSIPGRIHNVVLAANRMNGVLIAPGETFSFNRALGDISAATGYQSAYIIKDGRTILGDGGGVCQVSTTLFRAALDAGLPIVERKSHAYRVHYYEEGGYKAGLDATVFAPSTDLTIQNNTPAYILIQTATNTKNLTLTFDLYGVKDGRTAQILDHKVYDVVAPPPPLYQEDPTLPPGTTKQVDWAAWGAKAQFRYLVTRGDQTLEDTIFYSHFRPWQAVYLQGPQI